MQYVDWFPLLPKGSPIHQKTKYQPTTAFNFSTNLYFSFDFQVRQGTLTRTDKTDTKKTNTQEQILNRLRKTMKDKDIL